MARDQSQTTGASVSEAKPAKATCGICRKAVMANGWCENCQTWPLNVTPIRYCGTCNALVPPSGLCRKCGKYTRTELVPERYDWRDTRRSPRLIPREENARRMRMLGAILEGSLSREEILARIDRMEQDEPGIGWHEAAVALRAHIAGINRQYASRHLRTHGMVVGKTALGDDIVRYGTRAPMAEDVQPAEPVEEEAPFA